jgi:hypothetical protein
MEGYISPEAMVACLTGLPRLQSLIIDFRSASSRPDQIPSPVIRIFLPELTSFEFRGTGEYLEELISRIDSPRLNQIHIRYSHQPFVSQVTQLFQFIHRSEDPKLTSLKHADLAIPDLQAFFEVYSCSARYPGSGRGHGQVSVSIPCQGFDGQLSYILQVFSQLSALFSRVVHLKLSPSRHGANNEWLHLFRQFSAIRTLQVHGRFARQIAHVLESVTGEMAAEVLPVLDSIYIVKQPVSCVEKFLAARRLSGHPVTVVETSAAFRKSQVCEDETISSQVS